MSAEQNKQTVRRWVEAAWNNGDTSSAPDLYAADYTLHFNGDPAVKGAAGLGAFLAAYRGSFPDFHMHFEDVLADGDKVIWRITVTGTHEKEFMGIPALGRPISVHCTVISRFEDGKWAEDWVVNDSLSMLQQMGAIPTPEAAVA